MKFTPIVKFIRFSSSGLPAVTAAAAAAPPKVVKSTGSTLIERLSSFLVGVGVGFGANFYLVHEVISIFFNPLLMKLLKSF